MYKVGDIVIVNNGDYSGMFGTIIAVKSGKYDVSSISGHVIICDLEKEELESFA